LLFCNSSIGPLQPSFHTLWRFISELYANLLIRLFIVTGTMA
jgi:hypothetical protein